MVLINQAWCSSLSINYTVPLIGLEILSHPHLGQKHAAVVPRHVYLCNWPHKTAPRATLQAAPISPGRGPRGQAGPNKAHSLPAAQEQPLSLPHNYSAGPVKKPETLSLLHYSHTAKGTA